MAPGANEDTADLFHRLVELPHDKRPAVLDESCAGQPQRRARLLELLRADQDAAERTFWQGSALDAEAKALARQDAVTATGLRLGAYRIAGTLGRGGMGAVYLAVRDDDAYEKQVAIKVIQRGLDSDEALRRFRAERRILAQMEHPNIARLIDGGDTPEGLPYLVMEHVDGLPLDAYLREHTLPLAARLDLFLAVCSAVQYAHRSLVVHRDLKPANILVDADGTPKLLDFGIAALLGPEEPGSANRVMTLGYASPEQLRGEPATTSTDVFSLGVLLFLLLTGRRPYECAGADPETCARSIEQQWPPRAGELDRDWQSILRRSLAPAASERYESAGALMRDIAAWRQGRPVAARHGGRFYRAGRFVRRNIWTTGAAALAVCALLAGITTTSIQARRAEQRFNEVRTLANSLLFEFYNSVRNVPGSAAARELLVMRARQYLDSLAADRSGDEALQRELAEAYHKLGNIQGEPYGQNVGDSAGALESFRKSRVILESCVAAKPDDYAAAFDLVHTLQAEGNGLVRSGRFREAIAAHRWALRVSEELQRKAPGEHLYREEVPQCLRLLGNAVLMDAAVRDDDARRREALAIYRRALALQEPISRSEPASGLMQTKLGASLAYVGYALQGLAMAHNDSRMAREAQDFQRQSLDVLRRLSQAHPAELDLRRNLGDACNNYGMALLLDHRYAAALASHQEALAIDTQLAAADPSNIEARRDLAQTRWLLGRALDAGGHRAEARRYVHQAIDDFHSLGSLDPSDAENKRLLAMAEKDWRGMTR